MKHTKPRQVAIPTRQLTSMGFGRHPFPEAHIGDAGCQPWIHNCQVAVKEGPHRYRFMVFFKRHRHLAVNKCLKDMICQTPRLRSDVVVMRLGKEKEEYLNMRERDTLLADWLMRRCVDAGLSCFPYSCRRNLRFATQSFLLPGRKLPGDGNEIVFTKGRTSNRPLRT